MGLGMRELMFVVLEGTNNYEEDQALISTINNWHKDFIALRLSSSSLQCYGKKNPEYFSIALTI